MSKTKKNNVRFKIAEFRLEKSLLSKLKNAQLSQLNFMRIIFNQKLKTYI